MTKVGLDRGRRLFFGAIGAAAVGYALWPRVPKGAIGVPPGRVVVEYWEKWTGIEAAAVQSLVDRFNASQERIWVRRTSVSEIVPKTLVAIGGGDPPDVVGLYSYNVAPFAESRAVYSFDEAPKGIRIEQASYLPAIWRLLSVKDRQWAGVNSCYTLAMYCNRRLFAEAGIAPNKFPDTLQDIDAANARLVVNRNGNLERVGLLPNLPNWWPYVWPVTFHGSLFDAKKELATIASDECVAAYSWVQRLAAEIGPERGAQFANAYGRTIHSAQDPFISGRAAMIVQGPWLATFIRQHTPELDYTAVPIPADSSCFDPEEPVGLLEADVLMVPRGCKHPEAAFEFVAWMQRPEVQESLAAMHCKSSPMRSVSEGFVVNHPNRAVKAFDRVAKSPRVMTLPQTRVWQPYSDMTIGAFDRIWSGAEVAIVLGEVQSRAQVLVDRANALRNRRAANELVDAT